MGQTPFAKNLEVKHELKKEEKALAAEDKELNAILENPKNEGEFKGALEQSIALDKELYQHNMAKFKNTGNQEYLKEALKYTPRKREAYSELLDEDMSSTNRQAKASKKAQEAYAQRTFTLQDQMDTLAANKEYLSAKQRGQLSTIGHTLAKKGVIEYGE